MILAIWFCSLELYGKYLQKSWWSSGMIREKVTWVRFITRINAVYSKLPPINDLFLKILNQTDVFHRLSFRISDQKIFSAMLHQNIFRWNKLFNFLSNFLHSFMLIWTFQKQFQFSFYLQCCKLMTVNSQIKIFPLILSRQLNFGALLAQELFCVD